VATFTAASGASAMTGSATISFNGTEASIALVRTPTQRQRRAHRLGHGLDEGRPHNNILMSRKPGAAIADITAQFVLAPRRLDQLRDFVWVGDVTTAVRLNVAARTPH
jgi:hypothetical protein